MNPCDDCPIDDKIYECCGRFPETGETAVLETGDGREVFACPHLTPDGGCGIYKKRPHACRMHFCYGYDAVSSIKAGFIIPGVFFWNANGD